MGRARCVRLGRRWWSLRERSEEVDGVGGREGDGYVEWHD